MLKDFCQGDLVDVTIKGARVSHFNANNGHHLLFEYAAKGYAGDVIAGSVYLDAEAVTVERSVPAEYPPVPGDVWQTIEDDEVSAPTFWAAVNVDAITDGPMGVRLVCQNYHENGSNLITPEDLLKQGRPTLVFPSPLRATGGEQR